MPTFWCSFCLLICSFSTAFLLCGTIPSSEESFQPKRWQLSVINDGTRCPSEYGKWLSFFWHVNYDSNYRKVKNADEKSKRHKGEEEIGGNIGFVWENDGFVKLILLRIISCQNMIHYSDLWPLLIQRQSPLRNLFFASF